MTTAAANKLIQSIALNLKLDGENTPPLLESAALNYLIGKITRSQLLSKAQSLPMPTSMLFFRALELSTATPPPNFNIDTFLNMHTYLHMDEFSKCGTLRKTNLDSIYGSHTDYKYLKGSLKNVLARLNATKGSPKISKVDFTALLSHYLQELNILSPFQFKNGITRRLFISIFALSRGFEVDFALCSAKDFAYAENQAFLADNPQALFSCLSKCVSYIGQIHAAPHTFCRTRLNIRQQKPLKPLKKDKQKTKKTITLLPSPQLSSTIITSPPPQNSEALAQSPPPQEDYDDVNKRIKTIQEKLYELNKELNDILSSIKK